MPESPVRWGFLGAGYIARTALAPAVHAASGAVLQAVAARDIDRARALRPVGAAYSAYEEVLADPDVDAVYLSLTNEAHAPWSIAAMQAGKHVLCEKPLAMSAAEVDAMSAVAASSGRLLV
ncbi:MAG TPA: Gfo/Idh/MocA family oxidoreductase, partial [Ktedonobacterales bacterium]|nr:Gfo/Idh/MocA family oxidoreductase [Ktedonobacterales bacterium]